MRGFRTRHKVLRLHFDADGASSQLASKEDSARPKAGYVLGWNDCTVSCDGDDAADVGEDADGGCAPARPGPSLFPGVVAAPQRARGRDPWATQWVHCDGRNLRIRWEQELLNAAGGDARDVAALAADQGRACFAVRRAGAQRLSRRVRDDSCAVPERPKLQETTCAVHRTPVKSHATPRGSVRAGRHAWLGFQAPLDRLPAQRWLQQQMARPPPI